MTHLATHPGPNPDELTLIADPYTATGKPFADKFEAACRAEAALCGGCVDPTAVRLRLLDEPDYNPRQFAGLWGHVCGRDGFLDKTDVPVRIAGRGSRGNSNKSTVFRRLRSGAEQNGAAA